VVQLRVIKHLHDRVYCASLGIIRAIDQSLDPCVHQRSGAHRARLNCSKQLAVAQAMVTNDCTGFAQCHDLSMCCRIGTGKILVPSSGNDSPLAHDDGTHRNLTDVECTLRGAERFFHEEFVGVGRQWSILGSQIGGVSSRNDCSPGAWTRAVSAIAPGMVC